MSLESFEITEVVPGSPEDVYQAWMDSERHSAMIGSHVAIEPVVGGDITVDGGRMRGSILEFDLNGRILQLWRTPEFPPENADSRVEVFLEPAEGGARMTINHRFIPEGLGQQLEQQWREGWLEPMKRHFSSADRQVRAR